MFSQYSRFYRNAFTELFSSASTSQEPGSTTNNPEYLFFGWLLFLALRTKSPELFKDLVSCIHGLVAILVSFLLFCFVIDF
jgi:retinoblastoma-like protein 1